ncbi:MAG: hypothetical protein DHS20C16_19230 [Phycisphaerae bacterium]|nr:MAG: hypothetical protein DHS20C16_19230 [Phycisphaerae bacterium]
MGLGLPKTYRTVVWSIAVSCMAIFPCTVLGVTRYVDDDAPLAGDGQTWATAYRHLQDGLAEAAVNALITEIRVAGGTYHPDDSEGAAAVAGSRTESFVLQDEVVILGGYRGLAGGGDPNDRSTNEFVSTLSGDLDDNDGSNFVNNTENSFHVVRAEFGVDPTAILDGFEITAGNANGSNGPGTPNDVGGGFYNEDGNPKIIACRFVKNSADAGGAIRTDGGTLKITSCEFIQNRGVSTCGGVYFRQGQATLINGLFVGNTSFTGGGAIRIDEGAPLIANSAFSGNSVSSVLGVGGAAYFFGGTPTMINCSVSGNFAGDLGSGGGLYYNDGVATVLNSVIWGNRDGGGFDESAQVFDSFGGTTLRYCCIQDSNPADASIPFGGSGNHNIDDDPKFISDPNPGPDGMFNGVNDNYGNLRLGSNSPCIDAGSNGAVPPDSTDLNTNGNANEPLPLDLVGSDRFAEVVSIPDTGTGTRPIVDIGAYEAEIFPRVIDDLVVLYDFRDGNGTRILDVSSTGIPTDVFIQDGGAVTWLADSLSVDSNTIASSIGPAKRIIDECRSSRAITIEAWIELGALSQSGPARIATVSVDTNDRNVSFMQDDTSYSTRLRTTTTDNQGEPSTDTALNTTSNGLVHLVFTRRSNGEIKIYVDEAERASATVGGNFNNWDESYRFALFNEFTLDRSWLGEVHLLAVYSKALSALEVSQNFIVGPIVEGPGRTGDLDIDRDVDITDFQMLEDCMAGPGSSTILTGCNSAQFDDADLDRDGDVDLRDYRILTTAFTDSL